MENRNDIIKKKNLKEGIRQINKGWENYIWNARSKTYFGWKNFVENAKIES